MKKIISNIHYTLYGIRLSLAGDPLHEDLASANIVKDIPTFKDDKTNLKSDANCVIIDFKSIVDDKVAELETK